MTLNYTKFSDFGGNGTYGNKSSLSDNRPTPIHQLVMWTVPAIIICLNVLVFVVAPRMKSIRPCTSYGMINLAVADFSLGVLLVAKISYITHTDFELTDNDAMCKTYGFCMTLFGVVSIYTLAYMNLDRLILFSNPIHYARFTSSGLLVKGTLVGIWIFVIASISPMLAPSTTGVKVRYYSDRISCAPDWSGNKIYGRAMLTILFVLPSILILICFIGIFYLARRRRTSASGKPQLRKFSGDCVATITTVSGGDLRNRNHRGMMTKEVSQSQWQRDFRIFRTLAIMTFGFYIAWLPYVGLVTIPSLTTKWKCPPAAVFAAVWMVLSNSFWNPIIYMLTVRPFYQAMAILFSCGGTKNGYVIKKQPRQKSTSSPQNSSDTSDVPIDS